MRATSRSSTPHRRTSPSAWTISRPNAGSVTSLGPGDPGAERGEPLAGSLDRGTVLVRRRVQEDRLGRHGGAPTPAGSPAGRRAPGRADRRRGRPVRPGLPAEDDRARRPRAGGGAARLVASQREAKGQVRPEQVQQTHGYRSIGGGLSDRRGRWTRAGPVASRRTTTRPTKPTRARAPAARQAPRGPSSRPGRARQPSRGPPSAYRMASSASRPGGPYRLRATMARHRCPTTSRPSRIQPERRSSSRSPLASSTAAASPRPSPSGASTTSSVPARRASAASRPSRSPTRAPATAGSRPSGRSSTSRSTVRAASSEPASASASSRSRGTSTTSHSGRTPRATASTGSNARARSSHATMDPAACASAATRSASVVRPELAPPRSATVADRGSPPVPSTASSAAKPVGMTRPSSCAGMPGRAAGAKGFEGATTVNAGACSASASAPSPASSSTGSGATASAPWTTGAPSPQRRGAAVPHRAWRAARVWETSDARVIGRPIIERLFYSSRPMGRTLSVHGAALSAGGAPVHPARALGGAVAGSDAAPGGAVGGRSADRAAPCTRQGRGGPPLATPARVATRAPEPDDAPPMHPPNRRTPARPGHPPAPRAPSTGRAGGARPGCAIANSTTSTGPNELASVTIQTGACSRPTAKTENAAVSKTPARISSATTWRVTGCPGSRTARKRPEPVSIAITKTTTPAARLPMREPSRIGSHPWSRIGPAMTTPSRPKRTTVASAITTPGPTIRALRSVPSSSTTAVSHHAHGGEHRAGCLQSAQRLAAHDDRQDHRQPAVGDGNGADHADRPQAQRRHVGDVAGSREDPQREAHQHALDPAGTEQVGTQEREGDEREQAHHERADLHAQAADPPGREGPRDVDHAPSGGGEEAEGEPGEHRRRISGAARRKGACRVLHFPAGRPDSIGGGSRGDVAQLGEHRVRIAGVRGSSPLISTIRGSVGQVVSPRVCKTLAFGCGSSILPRPTSSLAR